MNTKKLLQEYRDVESEFFDVDQKRKKVCMKLEFKEPKDIFDTNAITKLPVLSDDFMDWLGTSFKYAPKNYKIDIDVSFDNMDGFNEEKLKDVFFKNMVLEAKKAMNRKRLKNRIAIILVCIGLAFLIPMLLLLGLWQNGGVAKDIVSYILDIAATVTIWEALTILIVENSEHTHIVKRMIERFDSISFHQKEA